MDDVECCAKKLSVWWEPDAGSGSVSGAWAMAQEVGLVVTITGAGPQVLIASTGPWVSVDFGTLRILLLGHARGLRVDLGECPACMGDGVQHWAYGFQWVRGGGPQWHKHRACPGCPPAKKTAAGARERGVRNGSGRRTALWAQAVLDARPLTVNERTEKLMAALDLDDEDSGTDGWDGDPEARAALHVLADRFQDDGDPLGTLLAAWLRGPCGECGGKDHAGEPDYRYRPGGLGAEELHAWRALERARDARKGLQPPGPDSGWQGFAEHPRLRRAALSLLRKHPDRVERRRSSLDRRQWHYRIRRKSACTTCHGHGTVLGALDVLMSETMARAIAKCSRGKAGAA